MALSDLPPRGDMNPVDPSATLGRRWRKDHPEFWRRLSPLGATRPDASQQGAETTRSAADDEGEAFSARLRELREAHLEEARRDAAKFSRASPGTDLRSSAIDGSMDDHEDDVEEESWP
jgi:hypothetical protein